MRTSSLCAPRTTLEAVFNLLLQGHAFDSGYLLHILITTTRGWPRWICVFFIIRGTLPTSAAGWRGISSAGMMPSSRASRSKAANASSSVTAGIFGTIGFSE